MLVDTFSRKFSYLRLSLTKKCNFSCSYCLPNGYVETHKCVPITLNEIRNLAIGFKELGIKKIRLTGGEPTLRADILDIVKILKQEIGIDEVALTTNGYRLNKLVDALKRSGLDTINISLDSLNSENFQKICGSKKHKEILLAIQDCLDTGINKVKINCVLLKGLNDFEFPQFLEYVRERSVSLRFIELMRTGDNKEYFSIHYESVDEKIRFLKESGWKLVSKSITSGPATEYTSTLYKGKIGFISPYSKDFCQSCNRLRVSSEGGLRLCLFGEGDISLREFLQDHKDKERLKNKILETLFLKPREHFLHNGRYGNMNTLSSIGG